MKSEDWIAFSREWPKAGQSVIIYCSDGSGPFVTHWDNSDKPGKNETFWTPFIAPEQEDGFEKWWNEVVKITHRSKLELLGWIGPKDGLELCKTVANAAYLEGKISVRQAEGKK
jgi:hypothetical protein